MTKAAQGALAASATVFAFDADPKTASNRAVLVLTLRGALPHADVGPREHFVDAAIRAVGEAGVDIGKRSASLLQLVGVDDEPTRNRAVVAWFSTTAPFETVSPGLWTAVAKGIKLNGGDTAALRAALERLRTETRHVAGAAALLGGVFTGDDLLRLHRALHGGLEGSERTFRRRVQELRDDGVLRVVPSGTIDGLRARTPRFQSPSGTGGRPPELLRYSGEGGESEQLVSLRARRS